MDEKQASESLWEFARFIVTQKGDIPAPIACFVTSKEIVFMHATRFMNKDDFAAAIRQTARDSHAHIVGLISSAWVVSRPNIDEIDDKLPSECDDKEEVILVFVKTSNNSICETAPLITTMNGDKVVGETVVLDGKSYNRFLDGVFDTVH